MGTCHVQLVVAVRTVHEAPLLARELGDRGHSRTTSWRMLSASRKLATACHEDE